VKLLSLVKDEGKSASDLLDHALQKTGKDDILRGQFMVLFKARELVIKDEKQASIKETVLADGYSGKHFGPRRIRLTPSMSLKFIAQCIQAETPLLVREA